MCDIQNFSLKMILSSHHFSEIVVHCLLNNSKFSPISKYSLILWITSLELTGRDIVMIWDGRRKKKCCVKIWWSGRPCGTSLLTWPLLDGNPSQIKILLWKSCNWSFSEYIDIFGFDYKVVQKILKKYNWLQFFFFFFSLSFNYFYCFI